MLSELRFPPVCGSTMKARLDFSVPNTFSQVGKLADTDSVNIEGQLYILTFSQSSGLHLNLI